MPADVDIRVGNRAQAVRSHVQVSARSILGAISIIATVSACGSLELLTEAGRAERGRETYVRYCAACHGTAGQGKGPVAVMLKRPPADLTRIANRRGGRFDLREVASYIDGRTHVAEHGPRDMPIWGRSLGEAEFPPGSRRPRLLPSNIYLVTDYLRGIQMQDEVSRP